MIMVATMLSLGCVGFVLFASDNPYLVLPGMLLAFTAGFGWPGLFQLAIVSIYPSAPVFATGITQAGAYIGASAGPFLFGLLVGTRSYASAWLMVGIWSISGAAIAMFGRLLLQREIARRPKLAQPGEQPLPEHH